MYNYAKYKEKNLKNKMKMFGIMLVFSIFFSQIAYAQNVLEGKIIILDAGHGAGDNTYADYSEGDTMYILAKKLVPLLEQQGATVYETRPGDENIELSVRTALINKISLEYLIDIKNEEKTSVSYMELLEINEEIQRMYELIECMEEIIDDPTTAGKYLNYPYDASTQISSELAEIFKFQSDSALTENFLMLSMHTNAHSSTIHDGGLILFEPFDTTDGNEYYYNDYSHVEYVTVFADLMLEELELIGFRDGGTRAQNLHMTRENNVPAALVESGFHTNDADREKLQGDENLDKLANAYLNAIVSYYTFDFSEVYVENNEDDTIVEFEPEVIIDYTNLAVSMATGNFSGFVSCLANILYN